MTAIIIFAWILCGYAGSRFLIHGLRRDIPHYSVDDGDRALACVFAVFGPLWLCIALLVSANWGRIGKYVGGARWIRALFP